MSDMDDWCWCSGPNSWGGVKIIQHLYFSRFLLGWTSICSARAPGFWAMAVLFSARVSALRGDWILQDEDVSLAATWAAHSVNSSFAGQFFPVNKCYTILQYLHCKTWWLTNMIYDDICVYIYTYICIYVYIYITFILAYVYVIN